MVNVAASNGTASSQILSKADLNALACSFITPEIAEQAKLYRVDSHAGSLLIGENKPGEDYSGIILPYISPINSQIVENCLRRDNPSIEIKPDGSQKEKKKYLFPPGRGNLLYFPPNCNPDWLTNISLPVVITEGVKKGLALHRASFHEVSDAVDQPRFLAIALPGVWNFRGRIGKTANSNGKRVIVTGLIPAFQLIKWKKRRVYILFDSNTATNQDVSNARRSLASELKNLGAKVFFVDMPQIDQCNGIDDALGKMEREESFDKACDFLFDLLDQATEKDSTLAASPFTLIENDGVYYTDEKGSKTKICSPLKIIAASRTQKSENQGRLLEWDDTIEPTIKHRWAVPVELVYKDSSDYIGYLVSRGLDLKNSRFGKQKLSEYITGSIPKNRLISASKTGWNDNLFVLPDETIGEVKENESVIFQSANVVEHSFQTKGTVDQWRENVSKLCAGNSRLVFSLSVAFGSCLLTPLCENGGGFHIRGTSSVGKTTALLVAGSVWGGDSNRGFLNTWRTTANGLEAIAELHNDALLCLDELKECDPRAASEIAYMLGNGRGKERMGKNILARKSLNWKLFFLSSGELSLSDLIEQNGGRKFGGQEVRMCDIPADAETGLGIFEDLHDVSSPELFAKKLSENSRKYYGAAIREFLKHISSQLHQLKEDWIEFRSKFIEKALSSINGVAGEVEKRVAGQFALAAFGGTWARDICGWSETEAMDSCKKIFEAWYNNPNGVGKTDSDSAISQVRHFLDRHGNSRFQNLGGIVADSEQKIIDQAGYKKMNSINETLFIISPEVFRKEVCKGFDPSFVARALKNKNCLISDKDKEFLKTERVDNGQSRKMYVISSEIFE